MTLITDLNSVSGHILQIVAPVHAGEFPEWFASGTLFLGPRPLLTCDVDPTNTLSLKMVTKGNKQDLQ